MITADPAALPVLLADLSLDERLPTRLGAGSGCRSARLLARLHAAPVGEVELAVGADGIEADALRAAVWAQLGPAIRKHLEADGLAAADEVPAAGFGPIEQCAAARAGRPAADAAEPVTVVIATRDRTAGLLACLDSLAQCTHPCFDVIVVDSAPRTDTTARALHGEQSWPFSVRYVQCAQPGLARAHNAALPYVDAALVAFTDDDVIIDTHWVSAIAAGFADPSVACVTGLILPAELATIAQVRVEQAGGFARGYERRSFSLARPPADPLFPFTAGRLGSGANMAFRTEWLRAAGGFDPAIGAGTLARGGDDLLAFLRVLLAGRTLVYEPCAIVRHRHRREDGEVRAQSFGYGVGLGAYLAAAVRAEPALLPRMLRRTGPALRPPAGPQFGEERGDGGRLSPGARLA